MCIKARARERKDVKTIRSRCMKELKEVKIEMNDYASEGLGHNWAAVKVG